MKLKTTPIPVNTPAVAASAKPVNMTPEQQYMHNVKQALPNVFHDLMKLAQENPIKTRQLFLITKKPYNGLITL